MIDESQQENRLNAVIWHLHDLGAQSILDLGCGSGDLLVRLSEMPQFTRVVGIDVSARALNEARQRLNLAIESDDSRISLRHASFAEPDARFKGFDAGVLLETIEHINPNLLSTVELAVFGCFRPKAVLVTTPNKDYNVIHGIPSGRFRHPDHRFEWGRNKFQKWSAGVAERNGYTVFFVDIGEMDLHLGSSTQMAVFQVK